MRLLQISLLFVITSVAKFVWADDALDNAKNISCAFGSGRQTTIQQNQTEWKSKDLEIKFSMDIDEIDTKNGTARVVNDDGSIVKLQIVKGSIGLILNSDLSAKFSSPNEMALLSNVVITPIKLSNGYPSVLNRTFYKMNVFLSFDVTSSSQYYGFCKIN